MNSRIKFFYVGCYVGMFALALAGGVLGALLDGLDGGLGEVVPLFVMLPAILLVFGYLGCAMWWVHDAWSSVPAEFREVPIIGPIAPSTAVALFFVPCFNLVWIFLCNIGLAESINRALATQSSTMRASTGLAVGACCLGIVPYCNYLIGPLAWFAWMEQADRARAELSKVDAHAIARVF